MRNAEPIWDRVEARRGPFVALADRVFDAPELLYEERRAAAEHEAMLRGLGFRVETGVAGIPTAVMGEAGEGGPVIAILGEYDALPGLSQEAGVAEPRPVEPGGNGHGCGHNLLGAAALLAASALKDRLAEAGLAARVRYYGCPAEEGGAAKAFMVREGLFADVDAAITWHPASWTGVADGRSLANMRVDFAFEGRSAHAAAAPELGRSALDACELMSVGVQYLREHVPDHARLHYAYLDAGGPAPNVVQARAKVRHLIRARDPAELAGLVERVRAIARGAALMTGTRVEARVFSAVSSLLPNRPLEEAMQAELERLGPVPFDEDDRDFARAIQATLTPADLASTFRRIGATPDPDLALCDFVAPLERRGEGGDGSTDVGDVSWAVPLVQARVATCAVGTPFHTWQTTAQGKGPAAAKGMLHAAKVVAATAERLARDPALLAAARRDHAARLEVTPFVRPLPDEATPPIP